MSWNNAAYRQPPSLPQYGMQRAYCQASIPKYAGMFTKCFGGFLGGTIALIGLGVSAERFNDQLPMMALVGGGAVAFGIAVYYWFANSYTMRPHPLFVYDGGIHFNESVSYVVPYGQFIEFRSGTREVSVPWRVIKNLKVNEAGKQQTITFSLPDGRHVRLDSGTSAENDLAVRTIVHHLNA